jgi:hypothetical protein
MKRLTQNQQDIMSILFLACLPLILFSDALFTSGELIYSFDIDYFYPHEVVLDASGYGEDFLVWNPYFGAGAPGLGKIQIGIFYPPLMLLRSLFSVETTLNLDAILHLFIAGTGVYFLMRQLSVGPIPALFAAVAFMLSGSLTPRIFAGHASVVRTVAWSGWLLFAYIRLLKWRVWHNAVFVAVIIGFVILGGHPQMSLTVLLLPLGYFFALFVPECIQLKQWRAILSGLSWSIGAVVLALGLTAVQLAPYLAWHRQTVRAAGYAFDSLEAMVQHSFLWQHFFTFIAPTFWYDPESAIAITFGSLSYFWETSAFTGVLTMLIVAVGLTMRSDQHQANRRFFVGLAIMGLLLSMGTINPLYDYLFQTMPYIRAPGRFMVWWTLAMSVVAGITLDILLKSPSSYTKLFNRANALALGGGLMMVFWLLLSTSQDYSTSSQEYSSQNYTHLLRQTVSHSVIELAIKLSAMAVLFLVMRSWRKYDRYLGILLVLALAVEMSLFTATITKPTPLFMLYRLESPYVQFNLLVDEHRFHDHRQPPLYLLPTLTHVENGEESGKLEKLLQEPNGINLLAANFKMTEDNLNDEEWQLTQTQNNWNLYTNRHNLPRIYAAPIVRQVANEGEVLQIVGDLSFAAWQEAIVVRPTASGHAAQLDQLATRASNGESPVFSGRYLSYQNNRLIAEVVADQPMMIVFSEMYDEGWQAAVNGETVPLWLVNYAFRGVMVEEGVSIITMEYRSRPYSLGLGISLLTILIMVAIIGNSYVRCSRHEQRN